MTAKATKQLLTYLTILFLGVSLLLGIRLVLQRQLLNNRASTATGAVFMKLTGPSSVTVGQSLPVNIVFDHIDSTTNSIGTLYLTLRYPSSAPVTLSQSDVQGNTSTGLTYGLVTVGTDPSDSSKTQIYIEASYQTAQALGFVPTANQVFATLNFHTVSPGSLTVEFDPNPSLSKALSKESVPQIYDILNSSLASATFSISTNSVPTATPTPIPAGVSITTGAFVPQNKTIYVGESVTWANNDSMAHTTTSDTGIWDSGTLNPGQTYTHVFPTAGVFSYHCSIHPGMTGVITVLALPTPIPTTPAGGGATSVPNNCNGTCGSNYNCQGGLACYFPDPTHPNEGFCRNPLDPGSLTCTVRTSTPIPTRRPTTRPRTTITPIVSYATPTPYVYEPFPTVTPSLAPTEVPTGNAGGPSTSQPFIVRVFIVIGLWLLILLLIIWLIKKYRDSQSAKEHEVDELANRFKTPPPPPVHP